MGSNRHRDLVVRVTADEALQSELADAFRRAFFDVMKERDLGRRDAGASFEAFSGQWSPSEMGNPKNDDWKRRGGVEIGRYP